MAYNPNLPANNSPVSSSELRSQLTGLKALIDAVPTSAAMMTVLTTNTAGPCLSVAHASTVVSNPPTQAQVSALANKINELLDTLQRNQEKSAPSS